MQPGVSLFGWLPGERRVSELGAGVGLHSLCVFLSQKIMRALHLKKHMNTLFTYAFLTVFRQCSDKVSFVGEEGGGGVGEGQTKRQIVGSLDMSSSLHQTKEIYRNVLLLCIADLKWQIC